MRTEARTETTEERGGGGLSFSAGGGGRGESLLLSGIINLIYILLLKFVNYVLTEYPEKKGNYTHAESMEQTFLPVEKTGISARNCKWIAATLTDLIHKIGELGECFVGNEVGYG